MLTDTRTREVQANLEASSNAAHVVYPRYDVPFNRENIKDFFTFRKGVVETAIQECITGLLFPEDGEYLGSWLLTEYVYIYLFSILHHCHRYVWGIHRYL